MRGAVAVRSAVVGVECGLVSGVCTGYNSLELSIVDFVSRLPSLLYSTASSGYKNTSDHFDDWLVGVVSRW